MVGKEPNNNNRKALSNEMYIYYETIILRNLLNIFTEEWIAYLEYNDIMQDAAQLAYV